MKLVGRKVYVYYNLHHSCWSIKDYKTGKVIAHRKKVFLKDVEYRVRQGGNKRVRNEGHKNVHAFVIGTIVSTDRSVKYKRSPIKYNPFRFTSFVNCRNNPIYNSDYCFMNDTRKCYKW
jgi:hypothetical protein